MSAPPSLDNTSGECYTGGMSTEQETGVRWSALASAWRVGATCDDLGTVDRRYEGDAWATACDAATCASAYGVSWPQYRVRVETYLSLGLSYSASREAVMDDLELGR